MTANAEYIYDVLPYPRLSYFHTTPDRLATIATLLGLEAPPLDGCRVLEVGSAVGGNLIPMAIRMPGSTFLGIDLSEAQTAEARAAVEQLGLRNITFEQRDITSFDDDLPPFDFIIAHGIYSWIPEAARHGLLQTCANRLSEHGIAMISYNVYPGWHALQAIRRMMQDAAAGLDNPYEKVAAAVDAIRFYRDISPDNHLLSQALAWYLEIEKSRLEVGDARRATLLIHDELSEVNDPCYFTDFVAEAARFGLGYIADAELPASFPNNLPEDVVAAISKRVTSPIEFEQSLDFVRNNTFRRSLLVRGDPPVQRRIDPSPSSLRRFLVRSRATSEDPVDVNDGKRVSFSVPAGARLTTDHPLSKAAMLELSSAMPEALSFDDLVDRAWKKVANRPSGPAPEDQQRLLGANLLRGFTYNIDLIELRLGRPSALTMVAGDRPLADAYSRLLVQDGGRVVTNAYHERIQLHPAQAFVLAHLDGEHDRASIARALEDMVETDDGEQRDAAGLVDQCVDFFAFAGLLIG